MEILMEYSVLVVAIIGIAAWGAVAMRRDYLQTKARAEKAKEEERELEKQRSEQALRELRLVQGTGQAKKSKKKRRKSA